MPRTLPSKGVTLSTQYRHCALRAVHQHLHRIDDLRLHLEVMSILAHAEWWCTRTASASAAVSLATVTRYNDTAPPGQCEGAWYIHRAADSMQLLALVEVSKGNS